ANHTRQFPSSQHVSQRHIGALAKERKLVNGVSRENVEPVVVGKRMLGSGIARILRTGAVVDGFRERVIYRERQSLRGSPVRLHLQAVVVGIDARIVEVDVGVALVWN